ncbi:hypothetical protein KY308_00285, partial [Candidatus Woesearchaeota archaeon]|nr:hypothetical protein [Candidatus Woesearchaeota archaeon]
KVVENGKRVRERRSLHEIREYCLDCIAKLPEKAKHVVEPEKYELKISAGLNRLVDSLTEKYGGVMVK